MPTKLTQSAVRQAQEEKTPGTQLYDDEVSGLRLVIGSKSSSYKLMGRINDGTGRYVSLTIGRADEITLKTARGKAVEFRQALSRGEDPRKPKSVVPTLKQALDRYVTARAGDLQPCTLESYSKKMDALMPTLGNLPMDKIDRETVRSCHEKMTKKNGPYAANGAMRILKLLFNDVARTFDLPPNPVSRAVRLNKETARNWSISPDDLPKMWRQLDALPDRVRAACWLLMLTTGLRCSNARMAMWEHLGDDGVLTIPRGKSGRQFKLPLPRLMIQELERVRQETKPLGSKFIFPSTVSKTGHIEQMARTDAFPYPPHGMRHTYRTHALEAGVDFQSITMLMDRNRPIWTAIQAAGA